MADSPPYFGRYTVTRNRNKATSKIRQLCQEVEVEMEAGTWQATSESESGSFKLYIVVQLQPEIIMVQVVRGPTFVILVKLPLPDGTTGVSSG